MLLTHNMGWCIVGICLVPKPWHFLARGFFLNFLFLFIRLILCILSVVSCIKIIIWILILYHVCVRSGLVIYHLKYIKMSLKILYIPDIVFLFLGVQQLFRSVGWIINTKIKHGVPVRGNECKWYFGLNVGMKIVWIIFVQILFCIRMWI